MSEAQTPGGAISCGALTSAFYMGAHYEKLKSCAPYISGGTHEADLLVATGRSCGPLVRVSTAESLSTHHDGSIFNH